MILINLIQTIMKNTKWTIYIVLGILVHTIVSDGFSQDWSQWRGPNRNGNVAEFTAPGWPAELTQQWKVTVNDSGGFLSKKSCISLVAWFLLTIDILSDNLSSRLWWRCFDNFFASPFSNAEITSLEIVWEWTCGVAINTSIININILLNILFLQLITFGRVFAKKSLIRLCLYIKCNNRTK